jgi:hypothetical protein
MRGFLYQAWTTALRWLALDDHTVLLCECGEDIAHTSRLLTRSPQTDILLEQVRHAERSVTLRSQRLVATLARFYGRHQATSGHRVRLRYTTNASPGRERGFTFPRKLPAIESWSWVAAGDAGPGETAATLEGLRCVLGAPQRGQPRTRDSGDVAAFRQFVRSASPDQLLEFMRSVEWAVGQPAYHDMRREVTESIVRRALHPPETASEAADKLLVTVLEKLAHRGPKPLEAAELRTVLADTAISATQNRLLRHIRGIEESLATIEAGVTRIERTQEAVIVPMLSRMEAMLSELPAEVREAILAPMGPH